MSSLAEFIASHKQLPCSLEKTVIRQLYGNRLPPIAYYSAYPRVDPIYIGSAFKTLPVIPKPEPPSKLAKRVIADYGSEVKTIHNGILDAVQSLVESNADIHWGEDTTQEDEQDDETTQEEEQDDKNTQETTQEYEHDDETSTQSTHDSFFDVESVQSIQDVRVAVQRKLEEVLDLLGSIETNGWSEGMQEGKEVLTSIYGPLHPDPPALGPDMEPYRFRLDTLESDVDVGPTEVSLPVEVRSPEEREVQCWAQVDTLRDALGELDAAVEELLAFRTRCFLSNEGVEGEDEKVMRLQKAVRSKVKKVILGVFLAGKAKGFGDGQQDLKRWYTVDEEDSWVYTFVHDDAVERIFIRGMPKRSFFFLDSDDDNDAGFMKRQKFY